MKGEGLSEEMQFKKTSHNLVFCPLRLLTFVIAESYNAIKKMKVLMLLLCVVFLAKSDIVEIYQIDCTSSCGYAGCFTITGGIFDTSIFYTNQYSCGQFVAELINITQRSISWSNATITVTCGENCSTLGFQVTNPSLYYYSCSSDVGTSLALLLSKLYNYGHVETKSISWSCITGSFNLVGLIIGVICGAVALIVIGVIYCCWRRSRRTAIVYVGNDPRKPLIIT